MSKNPSSHIDFDDWSALARRDPEAFERRRAEVLENFIQQMPESKQHRMRCLQWRVDRVRERASNPVAACIRLSQMMWESLMGDGGLLEALEDFQHGRRSPRLSQPSARVVRLPTRH